MAELIVLSPIRPIELGLSIWGEIQRSMCSSSWSKKGRREDGKKGRREEGYHDIFICL